jgi:lipopolysaccharide/colanic/teichoic acid biosynthesis glycosyltransferase
MLSQRGLYAGWLKPAFDYVAAAVGLVLCLPLMAVVAVAVRWRLGSPVFFAQVRPGKDGRPFRMIKFRTMTDARDDSGEMLSDDERLPPFGRWLRSTSLDELPELWNVLRGEMSIVGPRPLLTQYVELYTPEQARRHAVKPGLTGLAQVNGRNAISWEQKFAYDLQYVNELSLGLDLVILAKTVVRLFRRDGISAKSHSTMPLFTGTETDHDKHTSRAA